MERLLAGYIYMGKLVGTMLGKWYAKSGLVNVVLESHIPFVQISSIYQKTAVKA